MFKVCSKCKRKKSYEEYSKQKSHSDGLRSACKMCIASPRRENPEKVRLRDREYYKSNAKKVNQRSKKYHEANSEKIKKQSKKYRAANSEKIKLRGKKYYEDNREKIRAHQNKYQETTREKAKLNTKKWRRDNPVAAKLINKKWREDNSGKIRVLNAAYRARKRNAFIENVDYVEVWEHAKGACFYCSTKTPLEEMHVDHYIPLIKGGTHGYDNAVCACAPCNLSKGVSWPWNFMRSPDLDILCA